MRDLGHVMELLVLFVIVEKISTFCAFEDRQFLHFPSFGVVFDQLELTHSVGAVRIQVELRQIQGTDIPDVGTQEIEGQIHPNPFVGLTVVGLFKRWIQIPEIAFKVEGLGIWYPSLIK